MTDHPAKAAGCTKAQIAVFEMLASAPGSSGDSAQHRVLDALLKKGLIERQRRGLSFFYSVPIPIHMQWCQWSSEQPEIA